VQDLGHELWIGDAALIRASYVREQKTDKRDAAHIRQLAVEGRFPRLWTPDREQRDLRQLMLHRHKLVEIHSRVEKRTATPFYELGYAAQTALQKETPHWGVGLVEWGQDRGTTKAGNRTCLD
jgi:hypothetical protein